MGNTASAQDMTYPVNESSFSPSVGGDEWGWAGMGEVVGDGWGSGGMGETGGIRSGVLEAIR